MDDRNFEIMADNERIKVSIAVPIYGVENYIERCAKSLFEQTYINIEYIFVDDCSPDKSMDVLKKIIDRYPERAPFVKIVKHKKNLGLAAARNTGVNFATGQFIIHVDSDDWVEPELVQLCINKARKTGAEIILYGIIHEYSNKKRIDLKTSINANLLSPAEYLSQIITQKLSNSVWGKMYSMDLYKKNNVKALENVNYAEDYSVLPLLVYYANRLAGLEDILYHYNCSNETSFTHTFNLKHLQNKLEAYNFIKHFFLSKGLYEEEFIIELLQIYAWARRRSIVSRIDRDRIIKEIGSLNINMKCIKKLSFNHKIIVICDTLRLFTLTKIYVLIAESIGFSFKCLN